MVDRGAGDGVDGDGGCSEVRLPVLGSERCFWKSPRRGSFPVLDFSGGPKLEFGRANRRGFRKAFPKTAIRRSEVVPDAIGYFGRDVANVIADVFRRA